MPYSSQSMVFVLKAILKIIKKIIMSKKLQEDLFLTKTTDISLCATLCCLGYQIKEMEKEPTGRAIFSFERDDKLGKVIRQYFSHELKVEPSSYFNFLKEIKTQIYNLG